MLEDSVNSLAHAFTAGMFLRMNIEKRPPLKEGWAYLTYRLFFQNVHAWAL